MDLILILVALAFAGMGLAALARPAWIGGFFAVRIESADARNEVRAVYGGFGLAMAAVLLWAWQVPALRTGLVAAVSLALAGMAAGRLYSALLERPGRWPLFFGALEASGAVALWLAAGPGV